MNAFAEKLLEICLEESFVASSQFLMRHKTIEDKTHFDSDWQWWLFYFLDALSLRSQSVAQKTASRFLQSVERSSLMIMTKKKIYEKMQSMEFSSSSDQSYVSLPCYKKNIGSSQPPFLEIIDYHHHRDLPCLKESVFYLCLEPKIGKQYQHPSCFLWHNLWDKECFSLFIEKGRTNSDFQIEFKNVLEKDFSLEVFQEELCFLLLKKLYQQRLLWLGFRCWEVLVMSWKAFLWKHPRLCRFYDVAFAPYPQMKKRVLKQTKKNIALKKIAHIVNRIGDESYAPTKRVHTLLEGYRGTDWEVIVVSLEHTDEYQQEYYYTDMKFQSSHITGDKTIQKWLKMGIDVIFASQNQNFHYAQNEIAEKLTELGIDIVVIHDVSHMTYRLVHLIQQPILWVEHGNLIQDMVVESIMMSHSYFHRLYHQAKKVYVNTPYIAHSLRNSLKWTKETLGFSSKEFLLVTVSSSLEARLSQSMCDALSFILEKYPQAHYLIIGPSFSPQMIKKRFSLSIQDKVHLLGSCQNIHGLLSLCDVYVNEFPIGGGLIILEAIYAHLPVVTMGDIDGPLNACEGAFYFGYDHAITSCSIEDYIKTIEKLIGNRDDYQMWKEYTIRRCKELDVAEKFYTTFHKILLETVES